MSAFSAAVRARAGAVALSLEPRLLHGPLAVQEIDEEFVACGFLPRSSSRQLARIRLGFDVAYPGAWEFVGRGHRRTLQLLPEQLEAAAACRPRDLGLLRDPLLPPAPARVVPVRGVADLPEPRPPTLDEVAGRIGATAPWRHLTTRKRGRQVRRETVEEAVERGALIRLPAVGTAECRELIASRRAPCTERRNPIPPEMD